jgi:hypothetical protein
LTISHLMCVNNIFLTMERIKTPSFVEDLTHSRDYN